MIIRHRFNSSHLMVKIFGQLNHQPLKGITTCILVAHCISTCNSIAHIKSYILVPMLATCKHLNIQLQHMLLINANCTPSCNFTLSPPKVTRFRYMLFWYLLSSSCIICTTSCSFVAQASHITYNFTYNLGIHSLVDCITCTTSCNFKPTN